MRRLAGWCLSLVAALGCCVRVFASDPMPVALPESEAERLALVLRWEDERDAANPAWAALAADELPAVRKRAARALGRVGEPALVPLLEDLAWDGVAGVREEALFALGLVRHESAARALRRVLEREDLSTDETVAALMSLGRLGFSDDAARVGEYFGHADARIAAAALHGAWRFSASGNATQVVEIAASSEAPPALKRAAAHALSRRPPPGMKTALARLILDPDERVAVYGIRALGRVAESADNHMMDVVLANPTRPIPVQIAALNFLGQWPGHVEAASFARLLPGYESPFVSVAAVPALAQSGAAVATGYYKKFLERGHPVVVAAVLPEAAKISSSLVYPKMDEYLSHPSFLVRRAALRAALAAVPRDDKRTEAWARRALADRDLRVHIAAFETLCRLPSEDRDALIRLWAKDKHPMKRATAAERAGERLRAEAEGTEKRAAWQALLEDMYTRAPKDGVVREAVVDAMKETPEAAGFLRRAMEHDPDYGVRRMAAERLSDLDGKIHEADPRPREKKLPAFYERVLADVSPMREAVIRTEAGDIVISLRPDEAPLTVHNFAALAKTGFYKNVAFHRVVPDFVAQAGCPWSVGAGGPGYTIRCEVSALPYTRGAVGMAHAGKDTGGSQFFITHSPQPHLEGAYTLFGYVTEGMDVVDNIIEGTRILDIAIRGEEATKAKGAKGK